jgi:hemerythrin-like domain-containing protein
MPTNILINEHLIIEQVLNCLERIVERCQRGRKLEAGPTEDAIIFFRTFVERCHRSRVEAHLVPAMESAGVSPDRCLGCPMFERYAESRIHLDAMEAAIERASVGDAMALRRFMENAQAYIKVLLEYIARAEDCLFPIINQTLGEKDKGQLIHKLQDSNGEGLHDCTVERSIDIANRLADQLNVPRAAVMDSSRDRG